MSRLPFRFPVRRALALVIATSALGVAHAASLGVSAGTLSVWAMPTEVTDTTAPTITGSVAPTANAAGWNNTAVTVSFDCTDDWSGVASCTDPVSLSSEGAGQQVDGTGVDVAGNSSTTSVFVDIDLTFPIVDIVGINDGDIVQTIPSITCTASDALSGLAGACSVTVTPNGPGTNTVEARATDVAGNETVLLEYFQQLNICGSGPINVPCVVPFGTVFEGDLEWEADVLVLGEVEKKIKVDGGSVTVGSTGVVGDDIEQTGDGDITLEAGSSVDGKIKEDGPGSVFVDGSVGDPSIIGDDVREEDDGDLTIGSNAVVDGHVKEFGAGSLSVDGYVSGSVEEEGDGDLTVGPGAVVDKKVKETGAGSLTVNGSVNDDVEEQGPGDLTVNTSGFVDGKIKEAGAGSLFVDGYGRRSPSSATTCTKKVTAISRSDRTR